ncbi:hypothetical protein BN77_p40070 [Rhizobium mesoamericanum STM3625]|nr:hypothetical protein BN77_p40070 [Rhizobium mesoamericanum STM3625]
MPVTFWSRAGQFDSIEDFLLQTVFPVAAYCWRPRMSFIFERSEHSRRSSFISHDGNVPQLIADLFTYEVADAPANYCCLGLTAFANKIKAKNSYAIGNGNKPLHL